MESVSVTRAGTALTFSYDISKKLSSFRNVRISVIPKQQILKVETMVKNGLPLCRQLFSTGTFLYRINNTAFVRALCDKMGLELGRGYCYEYLYSDTKGAMYFMRNDYLATQGPLSISAADFVDITDEQNTPKVTVNPVVNVGHAAAVKPAPLNVETMTVTKPAGVEKGALDGVDFPIVPVSKPASTAPLFEDALPAFEEIKIGHAHSRAKRQDRVVTLTYYKQHDNFTGLYFNAAAAKLLKIGRHDKVKVFLSPSGAIAIKKDKSAALQFVPNSGCKNGGCVNSQELCESIVTKLPIVPKQHNRFYYDSHNKDFGYIFKLANDAKK